MGNKKPSMPPPVLAGAFCLFLAGILNPVIYFSPVCPPAEIPGWGKQPRRAAEDTVRKT